MNHSKIILTFEDENDLQVESLWALKIGQYYKIDNIPFLAPNIALNDLIEAREEEGELHFEKLVIPSGHSTIQIISFDDLSLQTLIQQLISLGCSWEGSHLRNLIAVDIPPSVNYSLIKKYLDEGESDGLWSYKEACLGQ